MTTTPNTVEDFVNDYEWRTDEFCHTPTERERDMLRDFAVMLADEGILADRAQHPTVAGSVTRWHHNEFSQEMHPDPIGEYVLFSDLAPAAPSMKKLVLDWWMTDMDDADFWNQSVRLLGIVNEDLDAYPARTPAAPVVAEGLDQAKYQNLRWRDGHEARVAAHPVAGSPAENGQMTKQESDARMYQYLRTKAKERGFVSPLDAIFAAAEPMPASEAASEPDGHLYRVRQSNGDWSEWRNAPRYEWHQWMTATHYECQPFYFAAPAAPTNKKG